MAIFLNGSLTTSDRLHVRQEHIPLIAATYSFKNIFFPLGKMIGTVRLRTSFILSSHSWEIGSPPTGGAGRMKLSCVVPASVIHI